MRSSSRELGYRSGVDGRSAKPFLPRPGRIAPSLTRGQPHRTALGREHLPRVPWRTRRTGRPGAWITAGAAKKPRVVACWWWTTSVTTRTPRKSILEAAGYEVLDRRRRRGGAGLADASRSMGPTWSVIDIEMPPKWTRRRPAPSLSRRATRFFPRNCGLLFNLARERSATRIRGHRGRRRWPIRQGVPFARTT